MGDAAPVPPTAGSGLTGPHLATGLHLRATPLGAFRAASARLPTPEVRFVRRLLREDRSPPLTPEVVARLAAAGADGGLAVLARLQDRGWVEGHEQPVEVAPAPLEEGLARTLPALSGRGHALLADRQGFCVASVGFPPDTAAVVAAFSADLVDTIERHAHRLDRLDEPGPGTGAAGILDGFGNSQLGFWPLFVGSQRFVLALAGLPRLNRPELVELVTRLSIRYGSEEFGGPPSGPPREDHA